MCYCVIQNLSVNIKLSLLPISSTKYSQESKPFFLNLFLSFKNVTSPVSQSLCWYPLPGMGHRMLRATPRVPNNWTRNSYLKQDTIRFSSESVPGDSQSEQTQEIWKQARTWAPKNVCRFYPVHRPYLKSSLYFTCQVCLTEKKDTSS